MARYSGPDDQGVVSRMFVKDKSLYDDMYSGREESYLGDASASYLYCKESAELIKKYNPDAKIIVLLRNPIYRAFSAYSHMRRDFREINSEFCGALSEEEFRISKGWMPIWHYKNMGFYYDQVQRYKKTFGDNVLILKFEELVLNPKAVLRKVECFLREDLSIESIDVSRVENDSRMPKNRMLHLFVRNPNFIKSMLSRFLSQRARARIKRFIKEVNADRKMDIDSASIHALKEEYQSDVERLKHLLNDDFNEWPEFRRGH